MKGLMKKALSFVMMMAMVATMLVLPNVDAKAATYCVAGDAPLCAKTWDASAYPMTANGDGTYSKTFTNVAVGTLKFKVTDGSWTNSWGADGGNENYVCENTKVADVTIKFNPTTKKITVSGAGISAYEFKVNSVTAAGPKGGAFLNDVDWDPASAKNHMTNNNGVWSIKYAGVAAGTYEYKFALNDAWTDQFSTGGNTLESGKKCDANISSNANTDKVVVAEDDSTVTLYLDLSAYDADAKTGAKTWVVVEAPKADDGNDDVNPDDGNDDVNPDDGNDDVNPDDGKEDDKQEDDKQEDDKKEDDKKEDNKKEDNAPKYEQKYTSATVVGDFSKLTNCNIKGNWKQDDTTGDMEYLGNGIYKFVMTFDKTTEEVTVEFKIAFDHKWDHSIGAKSTSTAEGFQDGGMGNNLKIVIPAGSTSVTIVANEADFAAYDSIQNEAAMNKLLAIAEDGIKETGDYAFLYALVLVAGLAVVAFASKKKFA